MKLKISQQGNLVNVKPVKRPNTAMRSRGDKGAITGFSRRSRANMMRKYAVVDKDAAGGAAFITLTYRSNFQNHQQGYLHLKAFVQRIKRRMPDAWGFWRKEVQQRGAIHYHLLIFNWQWWDWQELAQAWGEIVGEFSDCENRYPPRVDVRYAKTTRRVWHYIAKYLAKTDSQEVTLSIPQNSPKAKTGRWWGCINFELAPKCKVEVEYCNVTMGQYKALLDWFAKWLPAIRNGRVCDGFTALWFQDFAVSELVDSLLLHSQPAARVTGRLTAQKRLAQQHH